MTMPVIGPMATPAVSRIGVEPPRTEAPSGAGFASALGQGLQALQQTQSTADQLAVKAATGDLADVHDYMIASTQASLATELTVAVRNKAVDAFNEIMRMQA
jgi:flagellar hook-basal body complex protein FliE